MGGENSLSRFGQYLLLMSVVKLCDSYFDAVIDMVSDDQQTCTVTFDGYGTTEIVRVADLQVRDWDDPTAARVRSKTTK